MFKTLDKPLLAIFDKKQVTYEEMTELMSKAAMKQDIYEYDNEGKEFKIPFQEAEDKIYDFMLEIFELEKEDVRNAKLVSRAIRKNANRFFEVIEDVVDRSETYGWGSDPFFMKYVEIKNGNLGDENRFVVEDETVLTVSEVSGNNHYFTIQKLGYGSTFSLPVKTYGAMVGADIKQYITKQIDWTKLVSALLKAFDQKYKAAMYSELLAVGSKLPGTSLLNAAITASATGAKATFDGIIENVKSINGGTDVVIMGLKSDLNKLQAFADVDWISSEAKDDLYKNGSLGYHEGNELIAIPQMMEKKNGTYSNLVTPGHLYIFPKGYADKFIKVYKIGGMTTRTLDNRGDYYDDKMTFEAVETYGIGVVLGKYFGHVTIS